jgi:hypothetical protein
MDVVHLRRGLPLLVGLLAVGAPGVAFGFLPELHKEVAKEALGSRLRQERLEDINWALDEEDAFNPRLRLGGDAIHFNDCGFERAVRYLRKRYRDAVLHLHPGATAEEAREAARTFGSILHSAQDFYSHSNWVEQGLTRPVDTSLGHWPELVGADFASGVVFIDETLEEVEGWDFVLHPGACVSATVPGTQQKLKGIVTGAVGGLSLDCPVETSIGHWDLPGAGGGLQKDDTKRPGYETARALATAQTRHELCRLGQLLVKAYGPAQGLAALQRHWLQEELGLEDLCRAEPVRVDTCSDCAACDPSRREETFFNGRTYFRVSTSFASQGSAWKGLTAHVRRRILGSASLGGSVGFGPDGLHGGVRFGQHLQGFFVEASARGIRPDTVQGPGGYGLSLGYDFHPTGPVIGGAVSPGLAISAGVAMDPRPTIQLRPFMEVAVSFEWQPAPR